MKRHKLTWLVPVALLSVILIAINITGRESINSKGNIIPKRIENKRYSLLNSSSKVGVSEHTIVPANSKESDNGTSKSAVVIATRYTAVPQLGHIGFSENAETDNPGDNIFEFEINELSKSSNKVWLTYEIKGIADAYGISKSINDRSSYGGYVCDVNDGWTSVKEEISSQWLNIGRNRITFTKTHNGQNYSIRNLQVVVESSTPQNLTLSSPAVITDNGVYLHGFISDNIKSIIANGEILTTIDNEFESFIDKKDVVNITLVTQNNDELKQVIKPISKEDVNLIAFNRDIKHTDKKFIRGNNDSILFAGAELKIDSLNISRNLNLSITSLRDNDIPPLNYGMSNVTAEDAGYRFLPHGTHFENDGASISLKYDRTKIPSGYTEDDIRTFYFDTDKKLWIALDRIDVDTENLCVVSKTTHFTDMINGVIQAPESPETEGFTPTMMNDIKIADPAAGLNIIAPPTANNRGSANLNYPIETPPARNGMAPNLAISYNSDIADGWLGEGWDIQIPSITVDTRWGVPRYNKSIETETYLLNGMMLCTDDNDGSMSVAHWGEQIDRINNRQFHTRIAGDFSRIIRKGDSPSNYYWEVTDKNGTMYIYGQDGAFVKGYASHATDSVIAEWKLSKIIEPHGDYILYKYSSVSETAISSLKSKAIYLNEVQAYHKDMGDSPHTVIKFIRGKNKSIKTNNARYGFITTHGQLLDSIAVVFRGDLFRGYKFTYESGVFNKDLLVRLSEYDIDGNEAAYHRFDYANDIASGLYLEEKTYEVQNDNLNTILDGIGISSTTALGGSKNVTAGGSFYSGIGPIDGSPSKSSTGGVSVGYSHNSMTGISTLMDIDGDGLLDKVFKSGSNIFYRKQLQDDDNNLFGDAILINGINDISKSSSSTLSGGLKANVGWGYAVVTAGVDASRTTTKTTGYFSDVNGDGLPDYINNGKVNFNFLKSENGIYKPSFSLNSAFTSNPIYYSGDLLFADALNDSTEKEQSELIMNSPLVDAVKVWVAPKSGNIVIFGSAGLLQPNSGADVDEIAKADGVILSIEANAEKIWTQNISANDFDDKSFMKFITISKGEKIFFRVQSGNTETSNGNFDQVKFKPTIYYTSYIPSIIGPIVPEPLPFEPILSDDAQGDSETTGLTTPILPDLGPYNRYPLLSRVISPNGDYVNQYTIDESAIYSSESLIRLKDSLNTQFNLRGNIIKPVVTDSVTFRIVGYSDDEDSATIRHILWERETSPTDDLAIDIDSVISNPLSLLNLRFEISSPSNVRWQDVKWNPVITYQIENNSDTINAPVKYEVFAEQILHGTNVTLINPTVQVSGPVIGPIGGLNAEEGSADVNDFGPVQPGIISPKIKVRPSLYLADNSYNGTVTMKIKSLNKLHGTATYTIVDGVPQDMESFKSFNIPYNFTESPDTMQIWCEFFSNQYLLVDSLKFEAYLQPFNTAIPDSLWSHGKGNFYAKSEEQRFGSLYRGWGAFAYNSGNGRQEQLIDVESFGPEYHAEKYEESRNGVTDEDSITYHMTLDETPVFAVDVDKNNRNCWIGPHSNVFIADTIMSSGRLLAQDVVVENPLASMIDYASSLNGSVLGAPGISIKTKSDGNTIMAGVSIISRSDSESDGVIESSSLDLNGDGYPDIITVNNVQYTNHLGGLSNETANLTVKQASAASSESYGSGGNPVTAYTAGSGFIKSLCNIKESNTSDANSKGFNPNVNGSVGTNEDITLSSFVDINGDGLPDILAKQSNSLYAQINLGYGFSNSVYVGSDVIHNSTSQSFNIGAGLGFDLGAKSISGGIGAAKTITRTSHKLADVNGDGLTDVLFVDNGKIYVKLNNGSGLSSAIVWYNSNAIDKSTSYSVNADVSFTAVVPIIFLKMAFTPGVSVGTGISSSEFEIRDIDGDGFADILSSDSETSLNVTKSAIGRSNKLLSVSNSLGGKFHIDYKHTGASTDFPGGKWVMSSLVVDDGIHDDGSLIMNSFEYANGRKDRHEREFLGFGKVTTNNLDTDNDNDIYRKVVQEFNTSNYYAQGNLLSSYVSDASDKLYSKETNEYYSYGVTASGNQYNFETLSASHNSAYTPLKYKKKESFEGGNSGIILTESWYGYNVTGSGLKFGELTTFKFSDKGNLGNNGSGTYDYQTSIGYYNIISNDKYIWGLPNLVTVNSNSNTLLRKTSASYNNKGEIISLTQYLNNGNAVTNFEYDTYGNITKRTLPANNTGQRMCYTYTYETDMDMYVSSIADAYGYNSTLTNYDYRYGIPLKHIDINGRETTYTIDNLGRITSVLSPIDKPDVEIDGYSPYTIKFEYSNALINDNGTISEPAKALTYHFNKFSDNTEDYDIMTVAFCDGFGRNIQVQKEAIVGNTTGQSAHAMIVSGRTKYDAFGRVIESYYPTTVNYNDNFNFISTFDNITPTISEYDILDRTTQNILPDNTITSYGYNIDSSTQSIVTTITDANDNISKTYTNGSGKTVKTEQFVTQNSPIPTAFEYDAIGQLVKVTDAEGNITTSTYDMGGRVTQVIHPASGTTSYTYDNLGNITSKRTSNMTDGDSINYIYHFTRLSSVEYPNNPDNNILLQYGSSNENNSKGRVLIKTDGSGATEYRYDKLGNIVYERRSVVVPNNGIYTFVTQYSYDSFNRLRNITYPDGEIVTYNYDAGGNVCSVTHNKEADESDYVDTILYDKFNNRTYMKYGNGIISTYSYDPLRCRLSNMTAGNFIDKSYEYDAVSNILSITNNASATGDMSHSYSYDNLYRLTSANGIYSGADNKTASYNLTMGYDNMHRITSKKQLLTQENVQFDGTLYARYNMSYTYDNDHKFQLSTIADNNYRSVSNPGDSVYNTHTYQYDANGNLTYVATGRKMKDGHTEDLISERKLLWDDENRLMAISDNGYVSTYRYDSDGNRTVKLSGYGESVFVNGSDTGNVLTQTNRFTAYPNPYMVYNGSRYYKHIYVGSERIVSKVSVNNPDYDPRQENCAGNEITGYNVKLQSQQQALSDSVVSIYAKLEVPYYPNNNDDYDYNWSDGLRRSVANPDSYGELAYFYHSDHLGSTSYVTDANGEVSQHVEYVPFGEVFIEERNNTWNTPYLFNAKELDEETGLYYYGARYYDPRISLWLSTDPMELKYPNVSTYCYTFNNPIKFIDYKGLSPIYNKSGDFLGTSNEGFAGNILIYDGSEKVNFSQMAEQQILDNMVVFLYDEISQNIDNNVKSKIWTHVVSHFEGMRVYDEIFSMNSIRDGQISYERSDEASWVTYYKEDPIYKPKIVGSGGYSYETTVENIASSVIVHEWYSHGKKHNGNKYKSHRLAYKNVINFKQLWNKTTDKYKKFNLDRLLDYTKSETGKNIVDKPYRRLYNKYSKSGSK